MEAEDPLSQLRDIHLPEPVSLWPPAPGWWFLLLVLIVGSVYLYRHAIAAMIRRRKLASVLRELDQAREAFNEQSAFDNRRNQAGLEFLATTNNLLKRVAQVMYPESGSANLTGRDWLGFLDACDNSADFTEGAGTVLADGIYQRRFNADTEALYQAARLWIERRYQHASASVQERSAAA
jgi:hypothetical protein